MENKGNVSRWSCIWKKVPVFIKAIFTGLLISTIGIITWGVIAVVVPLPWSFIIMGVLLIIYLKYFSGSWWPKTNSNYRKECFRKTVIPKSELSIWIIVALLAVLIEQSGLVITFRLIEFPADKFLVEYNFLNDIPFWAAYLVIIMISLVAGICEELGFRGYMQVPLEKKYGAFGSITIVSIIFVLVHLHQAWSGPIIIHIFFISVLFGILAYKSNSLIPGIIGHFIMDIFNFTFWWADFGFQFSRETIGKTGVDLHFIIWILLFCFSMVSFLIMIRKMNIKSVNAFFSLRS